MYCISKTGTIHKPTSDRSNSSKYDGRGGEDLSRVMTLLLLQSPSPPFCSLIFVSIYSYEFTWTRLGTYMAPIDENEDVFVNATNDRVPICERNNPYAK